MDRRAINPRSWQDNFGFVQANEISGAQKMLFCSGQVSVDENGAPVHEGDMAAQATRRWTISKPCSRAPAWA